MYEDCALNEDSGPALPPKTAERNIPWSGPDSVQPPPKHGHLSETEIEAQLGIVRRRPVPPPPEEGGLPVVQQSTFMQTGQAEASGVVVVSSSSKCDTPLSKMESTEQLQFQGVANAESAPDSLSQNVASGYKTGKTYPVPAPRPTLKKLSPVESVFENVSSSLKKNPVALSSRDGQEVPRAESVVTRPKPPVPKKFDPSRHNTVSVAPPTNASASSSSGRATLCVADSRDNSTQAENPSESENPSSSVIKRPLKVPGKLKVDGLLAEQIKVAMTLRPSIVSAVNLLSSSSEISVAGETVNVPLSSTARTYVESIKAYKNKSAPLSPDGSSSFSSAGAISDDCISDGGEFYDDDDVDDFGFRRPSEDVLLKSVPIVQAQQHKVTEKKGYLYQYTRQKSTLGKLASQWQQRWVTLDAEALKYFSTNKVA